MLFLKIIAVAAGLAFLSFGYLIYFRKRYDLINGFEADQKAGRKSERYAKRVGLAELMIGAVFLAVGIVLIIFA